MLCIVYSIAKTSSLNSGDLFTLSFTCNYLVRTLLCVSLFLVYIECSHGMRYKINSFPCVFVIQFEDFLPDLPELMTPPVSSQDDDDDLISSSAPLKIDSSDVHRLFDEPTLRLIRVEFISFMGLVCVDIDLHVPFVMDISSKSSSIFSTGKLVGCCSVAGKPYGLEYFSNTSGECFRCPLDDA